MGRIIALTNQKGGVGKTTTAVHLGKGLILAKAARVLFVDMDPQCNMSFLLNGNIDGSTVMDLLLKKKGAWETIQKKDTTEIITSCPEMSSVEQYLTDVGREYRLRDALEQVKNDYDYIIIDSPPTLGIATINILTAADEVIIPALADVFSLQGIGQLYSTIETVRRYTNPSIKIDGILLTRHSDRFIHSRELRETIADTAGMIGTRVFKSSIRESVVIREATTSQMTVFEYAPKSNQAEDYWRFVKEFLGEDNPQVAK